MIRLSKTVTQTITLEFKWSKRDFTTIDQRYRQIRSKMSSNPMDECFWCQHKFVDGEVIALGCSNKGNKVLCQKCAEEAYEAEHEYSMVQQSTFEKSDTEKAIEKYIMGIDIGSMVQQTMENLDIKSQFVPIKDV